VASVVIGTCASWSVSGVSPFSDVVPQPAIVSSVPAVHRLPSLLPATFVGALVDGLASCSSVMSWPEVAR
jgi:hypothetical protein